MKKSLTLLSDKVALVTAVSGMGRVPAMKLAFVGAKAAISDLNDAGLAKTVEVIQNAGSEAVFIHTNVANVTSVDHLISTDSQKWRKSRVPVLVEREPLTGQPIAIDNSGNSKVVSSRVRALRTKLYIYRAILPVVWLLMTPAISGQKVDAHVADADSTNVVIEAPRNAQGPSQATQSGAPTLESDRRASPIQAPPQPPAFKWPLAKKLDAVHGVILDVSYLNISSANPTGGVNPGQAGNSGFLQVGLDLDLHKILKIPYGEIRIVESVFISKANASLNSATLRGHFFAQDVGSALGGQQFPNNSVSNYLSTLSYQMNYRHLDVEVGRMYKEEAFDIPNAQNSFSSGDPVFAYDNATPPPPYGTWGGRVKYSLPKHWFVQSGAYESNLDTARTNGLTWNASGATGAFSVGEFGYNSTFADTAYPARYEVGGFHDSSVFTNPFTSVRQVGTSAAFFRGQKTIWRADRGISRNPLIPHIDIFASASGTPDTFQRYRAYAEIGGNYDGPFKSRPFDRYGLKLAYLNVNRDELKAEQMYRVGFGGSSQFSKQNQFRIEANAHFAIIPGVGIEPVAEYIMNPNTMFSTPLRAERAPTNGIVLGVVLGIDLRSLLGLSSPPP